MLRQTDILVLRLLMRGFSPSREKLPDSDIFCDQRVSDALRDALTDSASEDTRAIIIDLALGRDPFAQQPIDKQHLLWTEDRVILAFANLVQTFKTIATSSQAAAKEPPHVESASEQRLRGIRELMKRVARSPGKPMLGPAVKRELSRGSQDAAPPTNHGKQWTETEKDALLERIAGDLPLAAIADLHGRTSGAIHSYAAKMLGTKTRPLPSFSEIREIVRDAKKASVPCRDVQAGDR